MSKASAYPYLPHVVSIVRTPSSFPRPFDASLDMAGKDQANRLPALLQKLAGTAGEGITVIAHSHLKRAVETMECMARHWSITSEADCTLSKTDWHLASLDDMRALWMRLSIKALTSDGSATHVIVLVEGMSVAPLAEFLLKERGLPSSHRVGEAHQSCKPAHGLMVFLPKGDVKRIEF